MRLIRKITSVSSGSRRPLCLLLACCFGATLGLLPGFAQAPGLIVLIALLLIVLNVHLPLALLLTLTAKAFTPLLLPALFQLGRMLLDGPAEPIFQALINAPVLALCGFEYYTTTGALLLGPAIGMASGLVILAAAALCRRGEDGGAHTHNMLRDHGLWRIARTALMVVGGSRGMTDGALGRSGGRLFRPVGVALTVIVLPLLLVTPLVLPGPVLARGIEAGFESAHSAELEIESAEFDLNRRRLLLRGFALADPQDPRHDLLRAEAVEASIRGVDLLRKRVTVTRLVLHGARTDVPRRGPEETPTGPSRHPVGPSHDPGSEGVMKAGDGLVRGPWMRRLAELRAYLEGLAAPATEGPSPPRRVRRRDPERELMARAERVGYRRVAADHLVDGGPALTVLELIAERVRAAGLEGQTVDVYGYDLSSAPRLRDGRPPRVRVVSSAKTFDLQLVFNGAARADGVNWVSLTCHDLPGDWLGRAAALAGDLPALSGGTVDVALSGMFRLAGVPFVDLPLRVTLTGTRLTLPGMGSVLIDRATVPMDVRGPMHDPEVEMDRGAVRRLVARAGAALLRERFGLGGGTGERVGRGGEGPGSEEGEAREAETDGEAIGRGALEGMGRKAADALDAWWGAG